MAYTATDFVKGGDTQRATSWSEHYNLIWDGYTVVGAIPSPPVGGDVPRAIFDAKGDLIAGSGDGRPVRVPVGANGLFLKADSTAPGGVSWSTASAGGVLASMVNAKGDLIAATADDTVARFGVGSNGQFLKANSAQASGLEWATLAKADVGLSAVDNTSDAGKPVSTAQQTALNLKANLASPAFTGTPTGITATHVGLGSVNNTADSAKPISTLQQAGLDLKVDKLTAAVLTATQQNTTVTPAVLTSHTFVIPPGKTLILNGQMIFTSAATTTGAALGIRVTQPVSASGPAQGSCSIEVGLTSAAAASGLRDGDAFNVAANTNALVEVLGTDTVAGNNSAAYQAVIKNTAAGHSTTVTVEFRSEVAASAITAQIGTAAAGVLV